MASSFKRKKVSKATEPVGGKIKPDGWSGSTAGGTVGGFGDAAANPAMLGADTARRGMGDGAKRVVGAPSNALPPRGAMKAKGMNTGPTGETAARAAASLARSGGKVKPPMTSAMRHKLPNLPAPRPSFPMADNPGGSSMPKGRS